MYKSILIGFIAVFLHIENVHTAAANALSASTSSLKSTSSSSTTTSPKTSTTSKSTSTQTSIIPTNTSKSKTTTSTAAPSPSFFPCEKVQNPYHAPDGYIFNITCGKTVPTNLQLIGFINASSPQDCINQCSTTYGCTIANFLPQSKGSAYYPYECILQYTSFDSYSQLGAQPAPAGSGFGELEYNTCDPNQNQECVPLPPPSSAINSPTTPKPSVTKTSSISISSAATITTTTYSPNTPVSTPAPETYTAANGDVFNITYGGYVIDDSTYQVGYSTYPTTETDCWERCSRSPNCTAADFESDNGGTCALWALYSTVYVLDQPVYAWAKLIQTNICAQIGDPYQSPNGKYWDVTCAQYIKYTSDDIIGFFSATSPQGCIKRCSTTKGCNLVDWTPEPAESDYYPYLCTLQDNTNLGDLVPIYTAQGPGFAALHTFPGGTAPTCNGNVTTECVERHA